MKKASFPPKQSYVNINFRERSISNLKLSEFIILQIVLRLSNNEKHAFYGSKKYLAVCTGLTERQVFTIISKLIERDFIHRAEKTGYLSVTLNYIDLIEKRKVEIDDEETSIQRVESSKKYEITSTNYEETSHDTKVNKKSKVIRDNQSTSPICHDYLKPEFDPFQEDFVEGNGRINVSEKNKAIARMVESVVEVYDESTTDYFITISRENYGEDNFRIFLLKACDAKKIYRNESRLYDDFKSAMKNNGYENLRSE